MLIVKLIGIGLACILGVILSLLTAYVLLLIVSSFFVDTNKYYKKNSRFYRWLLNSSTWLACLFGRIHLHVDGMDKIPKGTRFLLVGNHLSKFDPILGWYVFRAYDIAYLSKVENFSVPAYGRIIRKCCFMAIDRENIRNAVKTITDATELIKNDEVSIGVYPEGTRGPGGKLLPFHDVVFRIAQKAEVPIVVVANVNTDKIKDNFPLKKTDVYMEVVDVIDVDYLKEHRTPEIGDRVKISLNQRLQYEEGSKVNISLV